MKIAVAPSDPWGCGFLRMVVPYSQISERGHTVSFVSHTDDKRILESDVFVIQRMEDQVFFDFLVKLKKQRPNIKIVYELDDSFHHLPGTNMAATIHGNGKPATLRVEAYLKFVDLLTVSTQPLADFYQKFNKVVICQNCLPD